MKPIDDSFLKLVPELHQAWARNLLGKNFIELQTESRQAEKKQSFWNCFYMVTLISVVILSIYLIAKMVTINPEIEDYAPLFLGLILLVTIPILNKICRKRWRQCLKITNTYESAVQSFRSDLAIIAGVPLNSSILVQRLRNDSIKIRLLSAALAVLEENCAFKKAHLDSGPCDLEAILAAGNKLAMAQNHLDELCEASIRCGFNLTKNNWLEMAKLEYADRLKFANV